MYDCEEKKIFATQQVWRSVRLPPPHIMFVGCAFESAHCRYWLRGLDTRLADL